MILGQLRIWARATTYAALVGGKHDYIIIYIIYIIISPEEEKEHQDEDNFVKHQFWSGTSAEQIWSLPNRDAELPQKWYFAKRLKVFDETDRRKNRSKTLCGGANPILQMGETVGASQSKLKLEIVLRMANRVFQLAVKIQCIFNDLILVIYLALIYPK